MDLNWVEISGEALRHNVKEFRRLISEERILCPCVKGNAYGHGLVEAGRTLVEAGADWLGVNALYEAEALRSAGVEVPIYILGYVGLKDLARALELDCRLVVYNRETVEEIGRLGARARVHIKVETGNNRQGVLLEDLEEFADFIRSFPNIEIEGLTTHFANIEDTTDHSYAEKQLEIFEKAAEKVPVEIRHCANSAATILFEKTRFEMVRPGIAIYGLWPSKETLISYRQEVGGDFTLKPALTWKTRVAQIKEIEAGEYIGYGCTYRTGHKTRLAILPVGYYDGYDRGVTGGHVLIRGQRASIRGRICMNIMMVEITDIEGVELEDEVVLLGCDEDEVISAEQLASWAGTINYEVVSRINERIARIIR